jgi:hypothetical protein
LEALIKQIDCVKEKEAQQNKKNLYGKGAAASFF